MIDRDETDREFELRSQVEALLEENQDLNYIVMQANNELSDQVFWTICGWGMALFEFLLLMWIRFS